MSASAAPTRSGGSAPATHSSTTLPEANVERLRQLDTLRGVAICAVVGIHTSWHYVTHIGLTRPASKVLALCTLACGFGVPLFFALSAGGLAWRYPQLTRAEYVALLRRRAVRLLPAYVVWSVISLALWRPGALASPLRVVQSLARGDADAQFYYVPLVFQLYLAWPLFAPLARWSARSRAAALSILAVGVAATLAWWHGAWLGWIASPSYSLLPFFLAYACAGMCAVTRWRDVERLAARRPVRLGVFAVAAAAAAFLFARYLSSVASGLRPEVAFIAVTIFQDRALAYTCCVLLALALWAANHAETASSNAFARLADVSYGVFLVHLLVLRALSKEPFPMAVTKGEPDSVIVVKAVFAGLSTLAASAAFVALVSRSRHLRPLITNRW